LNLSRPHIGRTRHSRAGGNDASSATNNPGHPRLRGDEDDSLQADKSLFLPEQNIRFTPPASRLLFNASRMFCDLQLPNPFEIPAPFLKNSFRSYKIWPDSQGEANSQHVSINAVTATGFEQN